MLFRRLFRRSSRRPYDPDSRRLFDFSLGPDERIVLVTRSINAKLYDRSQSLITLPYPRKRLTNLNEWWHARDYLYLMFEYDVDWLINVDEDCFVFDNERLSGLLDHLRDNGYDFCGIPDGGACIHRFHNPVVMNPFFNIFNARKISPLLHASDIVGIEGITHDPTLEQHTPRHLLKPGHRFQYDNYECFYGFFFWLLKNGLKPLYLPSTELDDGLTTELRDHENRPFLYHTWFAREYGKDEAHTRRIDAAYAAAHALRKE